MTNSVLRDNYLVIMRKNISLLRDNLFGTRDSRKSAREPETDADWCIEFRGSIEVDTCLNLFGTRDSLKSAMASGAVEYKCL